MSGVERPEKGTRWRNPTLRGVWTVKVVGTKYVTLVSSIPDRPTATIPFAEFPGEGWKRVS